MPHSSFHLPPDLAERVVWASRPAPNPNGRFVLLWTRMALREEDHPALEAALHLAERLGLPPLVYQGLSERTPYANDRIHTFILEGARDAHADWRARGIPSVLHVERAGARGKVLQDLAADAAIVLTDHVPLEPLRGWTKSLAEAIAAPVLAMDCACIVPVVLTQRAPERAFAFRDGTAKARAARIDRPIPRGQDPRGASVPPLPFEPVDPAAMDIEDLIARSAIDHSVAPVPDTRGGTRAGLARWERFKERGLARYERDRNNALLRFGVSRMSPYLHFGMVSPFRLAREALSLGADKWLDELLIWREIAWHFCHHTRDVDGLAALPPWALATLKAHASDPRPKLPGRLALARGASGEELWDAAQRSLRIHGELHNNLRMTWGKALLAWTDGPKTALETLIDLNHRYALDGRDPASYGGLLWCMGLFDRPFEPEAPILGTVRPRPVEEHARRLDVAAYARRVAQPAIQPAPRFAVVGAGIAGLAAARTLKDHGLAVTVFERSGRPGGRLASTKVAEALVDHGPQSFGALDPAFRRVVDGLLEIGVLARWTPRVAGLAHADEERFVAQPSMNALAAHLAEDLVLRREEPIVRISRGAQGWQLFGKDDALVLEADALILALPAPQVARMTEAVAPELSAGARSRSLQPIFAAVVRSEDPVAFDLWEHPTDLLLRASRAASRPGRRVDPNVYTLHMNAEASAARLLDAERSALERGATPPKDDATAARDAGLGLELAARFAEIAGMRRPEVLLVHRWGLAQPLGAPDFGGLRALFAQDLLLAAAGDAFAEGGVEGAWLSGVAAAGRLLGALARRMPDATTPAQGQLFR